MNKTYYVVEGKDDYYQSNKFKSLLTALNEYNELIECDKEEFVIAEGEVNYNIVKYEIINNNTMHFEIVK